MLETEGWRVLRKKSFHSPDQIQDEVLEHTKIVTIGQTTFKRRVLHPGWNIAESYEDSHLHIQLKGQLHVRLNNGIEQDFIPGDVGILPPGFSSWVEGDKHATILEVFGNGPYIEPALTPAVTANEEREVLKHRANDFIIALNTFEGSNVASMFADEAEFISARGKVIHGRDEIANYFARHFRTAIPPTSSFRIYGGNYRLLRPDIANVDLYWNLAKNNTEEPIVYGAGLIALTLVKELSEWRILVMHSIDLSRELEENESGPILTW